MFFSVNYQRIMSNWKFNNVVIALFTKSEPKYKYSCMYVRMFAYVLIHLYAHLPSAYRKKSKYNSQKRDFLFIFFKKLCPAPIKKKNSFSNFNKLFTSFQGIKKFEMQMKMFFLVGISLKKLSV